MITFNRSRYEITRSNDDIQVPEIIDPVFAKTSQNARFLLSENERFGLVFVKTGSINPGKGHWKIGDDCGRKYYLGE
jgi:hypothetical protein